MGFEFFLLGRGPRPNGFTDFSTGSRHRTHWVEDFFYWVTVNDPLGSEVFLLGRALEPNGFGIFSNGSRSPTQWVPYAIHPAAAFSWRPFRTTHQAGAFCPRPKRPSCQRSTTELAKRPLWLERICCSASSPPPQHSCLATLSRRAADWPAETPRSGATLRPARRPDPEPYRQAGRIPPSAAAEDVRRDVRHSRTRSSSRDSRSRAGARARRGAPPSRRRARARRPCRRGEGWDRESSRPRSPLPPERPPGSVRRGRRACGSGEIYRSSHRERTERPCRPPSTTRSSTAPRRCSES